MLQIGSLLFSKDRIKAANLVREGHIIGVFNRGVNALWTDASNKEAIATISNIKGELRGNRPVALTLGLEELVKMIKIDHLPKEVRDFIDLADDLKEHLGSLCFIKAPIKQEFSDEIPQSSLSYDKEGQAWVQSWDPYGHKPTELLIKQMFKDGVTYPAVTSMNISGSPEIVDQDEAIEFCKKRGVSMYLKDENANPLIQGSYTILTLSKQGIELTRDGNIAGRFIEPIFKDLKFIVDISKTPNFPQLEIPQELISGLSPKGVRMAILLFLQGKDAIRINKTLKRKKYL